MKKFKLNALTWLIALCCIFITLYSCSDDSSSDDESGIVDDPGVGDDSDNGDSDGDGDGDSGDGDDTGGSASCDSCETIPADDDDFMSVLADSKLQSDFLDADNKDLVNFCAADFFYLCEDQMIFRATGGDDERTELRQERSLALNDFSDMEFEATYTEVPTTSSSKGVTIAQIHNDFPDVGRPLVRVDIINGDTVRSHVNQSFVKNDGSASNDDLVAFTEGDLLYVKLEISSARDEVMVLVENKTQGTQNSITYTVNEQWDAADGEYYFKAGLYTQEPGPQTIARFDYITYRY